MTGTKRKRVPFGERTPEISYVPTEAERAWAAGLFEGEGCFAWQWTDGRRYPKAYLGTTDPDVLQRFAKIIGVGRIYAVRSRPAHWKPFEAWVAGGIENVLRVAKVVGPYLGERRSAKLAEMLTWEPAERPPRKDHCSEPITASQAGHQAHLFYGEKTCDRCRLSANLYKQEYRRTHVR